MHAHESRLEGGESAEKWVLRKCSEWCLRAIVRAPSFFLSLSSLSPSLSGCRFVSLSPALSLGLSFSRSLALSLSRSLALSPSPSLVLSLSRPLPFLPSRPLPLARSLACSPFLFFLLPLGLSRFLSISLRLSHAHALARTRARELSRSLFVSLSVFIFLLALASVNLPHASAYSCLPTCTVTARHHPLPVL